MANAKAWRVRVELNAFQEKWKCSSIHLSDLWFLTKGAKISADHLEEYCAEVESSPQNLRGEKTISGCSSVVLPSRDEGTLLLIDRL